MTTRLTDIARPARAGVGPGLSGDSGGGRLSTAAISILRCVASLNGQGHAATILMYSEWPMLLIMAGLPATGKTTLARAIAERTGAVVLDKDVIRASLFPAQLIEYSHE